MTPSWRNRSFAAALPAHTPVDLVLAEAGMTYELGSDNATALRSSLMCTRINVSVLSSPFATRRSVWPAACRQRAALRRPAVHADEEDVTRPVRR